MVDIDPVAVEKAQKRIADSISRVAKKKFGEGDDANKFISESLNQLRTSTDAVASVESADLVVEAIVENLKIKKELFSKLDNVSCSDIWFAYIEVRCIIIPNLSQVQDLRQGSFWGYYQISGHRLY